MSEMDLHETAVTDDAQETAPGAMNAPDDPEAPEADAVDQHTEVVGSDHLVAAPRPDDVDPADHADQQRVVAHDDDDYR